MSVCIAAKSNKQDLVMVSDHMVTLHGGAIASEQAMLKIRHVGGNWSLMFAGDDVTSAVPIVRAVDSILANEQGETEFYNLEAVVDVLRRVYQAERIQRAVDAHLSVYGLDMATFIHEGVGMFGETGAGIIRERIEHEELQCDILMCGHGPKGQAHIITVSANGTVKNFDTPGYWVIGSGSLLALTTLASRQQSILKSLAATIYHACEAKFAAEHALGVGSKGTLVVIGYPNGQYQNLPSEAIQSIKKAWETEARPKYPKEIFPKISAILKGTLKEQLDSKTESAE